MPQGGGLARYKAMLMERRGPLPMWAWIVMVIALLLAVTWWRRNRAAAQQNESATGLASDSFDNGGAPGIFLLQQPANVPQVNVHVDPATTVPTSPPGGGADTPSAAPTSVSAPGPSVSLYDWVANLNSQYKLGYGTTGAAFIALFGTDQQPNAGLNPGYRKYIKWRAGPNGPVPWFDPNWSGRTPPLGIPPVRIR